jgi:hypothetical protein
MAQVMQGSGGEAGASEGLRPVAREIDRSLAVCAGEYPNSVLTPMGRLLPHHLQDRPGQRHGPPHALGAGRDLEQPPFDVDILPAAREQFVLPRPGAQREGHQ